jgi:hypothetical protein
MNDEQLGVALKEAADRWSTPAFDAAAIAAQSADRGRRARRRGLGSLLGVLVVAGAIALAVTGSGQHAPSSPGAQGSPSRATHRSTGNAPARPILVRIRPLQHTGVRIDRAAVLVRVPVGTPATVRARLNFEGNRPGRVRDTAIVVARPGTEPAAAPSGTGSYYLSTRVAISARVDATSPMQRVLRVTTPANLPPGVYPVLTVIHTVLVRGQPTSGLYGPFSETSELGVIVITPPR